MGLVSEKERALLAPLPSLSPPPLPLTWIPAASSSSARPASAAASACSFSTPMDSIKAAVSADRRATTSCSSASAAPRAATWSRAATILATPASSRAWAADEAAPLSASSLTYSVPARKKAVGVAKAGRPSAARARAHAPLAARWAATMKAATPGLRASGTAAMEVTVRVAIECRACVWGVVGGGWLVTVATFAACPRALSLHPLSPLLATRGSR